MSVQLPTLAALLSSHWIVLWVGTVNGLDVSEERKTFSSFRKQTFVCIRYSFCRPVTIPTEPYLPPKLVKWDQSTKERQMVITNWPDLFWNSFGLVWCCVISIRGKWSHFSSADTVYQKRQFRIFFNLFPTKFVETQKMSSNVDTHKSVQTALWFLAKVLPGSWNNSETRTTQNAIS